MESYQNKRNSNFLSLINVFINDNILYILAVCIVILLIILNIDKRTFFPNFVPFSLLIIFIGMFICSSFQKLKVKIRSEYGLKFQSIFNYIESFFSYFFATKTQIISDSFRAKTNYSNSPSLNKSFDKNNNTILDKSNEKLPFLYNNYIPEPPKKNIQEEDVNIYKMITSTEKKRKQSSEPHEIKRNTTRISEVLPSKNYMASVTKNIKGSSFLYYFSKKIFPLIIRNSTA